MASPLPVPPRLSSSDTLACILLLTFALTSACKRHDTGGEVLGSVYTVVGGGGEFAPPPGPEIFLPDIKVYLHNLDANTEGPAVTTDNFGRYRFPKQLPGRYHLRWKSQLGWDAGGHPDTIVVNSHPRYPTSARLSSKLGVVSGRVSFADATTTWSYDELFGVDRTATVTVLNAPRTDTLGGPVHANAVGLYAVAGLPRGTSVSLRVESEAAIVNRAVASTAVSFGVTVPTTDVALPNRRPEILDVVPLVGGNPVKTAAAGATITLRGVTRDGNGDPLNHTWMALPGHGAIAGTGATVQWTLPAAPGEHVAYLQVADGRGGYARHRVALISDLTHVTFSGRAVDKVTGAPLPGADVSVNGDLAPTDANGFFSVKTPLTDRYVMNIRHAGHVPLSRVVDAALTGQTWALRRVQTRTVDPTQPIVLVDTSSREKQRQRRGMVVRVPANALVGPGGAAPAGTLTANFASLDIADGEAPGDWGATDGGREKNLISYGAGFVEFVDGAGKPFNLRSGVTAEVDLWSSAAVLPGAPATTKTWSYNDQTGFWEVSGRSRRLASGLGFVNSVTHFSYINTDLEKDQAACLGVMIYPPISTGVKLRVTDPTGAVFSQAFEFVLDAGINGVYRLPANTDVRLELFDPDGSPYDGPLVLEETIGVALPSNVINTGPPLAPGASLWPPEPYVPPCKLAVLRELNEPTASAFLAFKGPGDLAGATAYYGAVDPTSSRETLREWWETNGFTFPDVNGNGTLDDPDFGAPPTNAVRTSYLNFNDLGSGRDMYFLRRADGTVAAYVTNYGQFNQDHGNADLAASRTGPGATVCMEYSPVENEASGTRIVKFFVYAGNGGGPNAVRQPSANLDGFGEKFVPNLCNNCHGGNYNGGGTFADVNMGASFRELDIATYKYPSGRDAADATEKAAFKQQNVIVQAGAGDAISGKSIKDLIAGWYAGGTDDQDNTYRPPGWVGAPRQTLYDDIIRHSCRTCHVALGSGDGSNFDIDWTTYDQFKQRRGFMPSFVLCTERFMPHAAITYRNFWLSTTPHRPAVLRDYQDGSQWAKLGVCAAP